MMDAASRDGYGAALLDLSENDKIVVLEADLGKSTKSCLFRAEHPQRAFSMGIAEPVSYTHLTLPTTPYV